MITQNGSGYSKKDDMTVYRWKGDSTTDSTGMFFYIKDEGLMNIGVLHMNLAKRIGDYNVEFTLDKANSKEKIRI